MSAWHLPRSMAKLTRSSACTPGKRLVIWLKARKDMGAHEEREMLENQSVPGFGRARIRMVGFMRGILARFRRPFTKKSVSFVSCISWALAEFDPIAIVAHETHERHENWSAP